MLGVALAFIALLAFLTLFVLFSSGPDVLVVISLGVLALSRSGSSARSATADLRRPVLRMEQ